jgi:N-dimethylarginine dimethylaminohydrolase
MKDSTPRILMCPPDYYGIEYEINPWMHREVAANRERAEVQWNGLVAILRGLGVQIELLTPKAGLPDLVFTANAGVVRHRTFIPSHFRHHQRQGEQAVFIDWFEKNGWKVVSLPTTTAFEGAGDALYCGRLLFAGYVHRSEITSHAQLGRLFDCPVLSLELVDPHFYHLDTCFCPIAPGVALYYPEAFDEYGRRVLQENVETLIPVVKPEADRFACNAVVVGTNVVHNSGCPETARQLEKLGFIFHPTDLDEFIKAGGSAKCLTLRLDGEEAAQW